MEVDVAFDPVDVGLFGADGIVFDPDAVTDSISSFLEVGSTACFTSSRLACCSFRYIICSLSGIVYSARGLVQGIIRRISANATLGTG